MKCSDFRRMTRPVLGWARRGRSRSQHPMANSFLSLFLQKLCPHRFSWPHSAHGQDYQVCVICGTAYEYDWATMRRVRRLAAPLQALNLDEASRNVRGSQRGDHTIVQSPTRAQPQSRLPGPACSTVFSSPSEERTNSSVKPRTANQLFE